jgi:prepilin-type N-terminal cleavage/methylation domain-containing protein
MSMNDKGFSLLETVVVIGLILVVAAFAAPAIKAYSVQSHILGAGRQFKWEFMKARSVAVRSGVQTAIRFEVSADGQDQYSTYSDGNGNGVLSADIESGVDYRISGPLPLAGGAPGVRVGILPGLKDPDGQPLEPTDPIRFGRSNMLSFSPFGTASPGTFYLAGEGVQGAVRVTPGSARVRMILCRKNRWIER